MAKVLSQVIVNEKEITSQYGHQCNSNLLIYKLKPQEILITKHNY